MDNCNACGRELVLGSWPFCPHGIGHSNVNGDEIPGGQWQENGFHEPRLFYSKRERTRALAEKGLEERVCNAGVHDTIVPRWVTTDAQTLRNAEILASRHGHATADVPEPDIPMTWTVRDLP